MSVDAHSSVFIVMSLVVCVSGYFPSDMPADMFLVLCVSGYVPSGVSLGMSLVVFQ